ncbi:MAG: glycosyltransferase [Paludibacteraceae bacterium]
MIQRVAFISTMHYSLDDRIFYHFAKSLKSKLSEILIVSTKEFLKTTVDGIEIDSFDSEKLSRSEIFSLVDKRLSDFLPEAVFCDNPMAVFIAKKYVKTIKIPIIYDITEWYPSKKNLLQFNFTKRIFRATLLSFFTLLSGFVADSFIFGEYYKSIPFKIFFWKKKALIPYYINKDYLSIFPRNNRLRKECRCLYSGIVNKDKGIENLLPGIYQAALQRPDTNFRLTIIGKFINEDDTRRYELFFAEYAIENFTIEIVPHMDFPYFCKVVGNYDLYFDLREDDLENRHCLPIKLFLYLACERPVIYSSLKSIRKEIADFNFGYLCNPKNSKEIADKILQYVDNQEKYNAHCEMAKDISTTKYDWKLIESRLISLVESL